MSIDPDKYTLLLAHLHQVVLPNRPTPTDCAHIALGHSTALSNVLIELYQIQPNKIDPALYIQNIDAQFLRAIRTTVNQGIDPIKNDTR